MTLVELLVVITITTILAAVGMPAVNSAMKAAKMNAAMQGARGIGIGLRTLAEDHDGIFPGRQSLETGDEYSNSNEIFRDLIPEYVDQERVWKCPLSR